GGGPERLLLMLPGGELRVRLMLLRPGFLVLRLRSPVRVGLVRPSRVRTRLLRPRRVRTRLLRTRTVRVRLPGSVRIRLLLSGPVRARLLRLPVGL
ncbi:hypothetical protein G3M55_77345, partial [Streptomyces sp. SID8455]|nr:hypothetical protein [Streptomyces sp. SID8455]